VGVALRALLLEHAAALVAAHGLRADDAMQLACARAARNADPQVSVFLCFDSGLRAAAARDQFALSCLRGCLGTTGRLHRDDGRREQRSSVSVG
jgi:hypothetical protein